MELRPCAWKSDSGWTRSSVAGTATASGVGGGTDWLPSAADCSVCSGGGSSINAPPMMKSTIDKTHTPTDAARLGKRAHFGRMSPTTAYTNTATDAVTRIIPIGVLL